ncbi:MAG: outer membrane protein, partial [Polaribacter sp.]
MKLKLFICLMVFGVSASAQEVLTRDDAMKLALQHNYDIQVAQKSIESSKNNKSIYNTGYLPTATASGSGQVTFNAGENSTVQGDQTFEAAAAYNYSASVGVNYVIFNGLGRMYNYKQLKEQHSLTELQAKQIIENTILQLSNSYFEIARLSENIGILQNALEISKTRMKRAEY